MVRRMFSAAVRACCIATWATPGSGSPGWCDEGPREPCDQARQLPTADDGYSGGPTDRRHHPLILVADLPPRLAPNGPEDVLRGGARLLHRHLGHARQWLAGLVGEVRQVAD